MSLIVFSLFLWLHPNSPQPRPELTPAEVVRAVVTALEDNNSPIPNAGVFTAYRFASPANHAITGPYGHFLSLVKGPGFAPLLHGNIVGFEPVHIEASGAHQVLVVHMNGADVAFVFTLTRQQTGPNRDCWMVDSVAVSQKP